MIASITRPVGALRPYSGRRWPAGVLIKGPLIVMIIGLAALTLGIVDRSARWLLQLKPIAGIAWFAVLVLPWFVAIMGRSGGEFLAESVGEDLLSKVFTAQEAHGAPPGYYFVLFWLTFWPGAMLAALSAPAVWVTRYQPATKFLLAWVVPSWVIFELVVTKLPHYVLPLYPAIAILIAGAVDARALSPRRWLVWGTVWWFVGPLIAGIAGIVTLAVIGRQFGLLAWPLIGARSSWAYWRGGSMRSTAPSIRSCVQWRRPVDRHRDFRFVVPGLTYFFPSPMLARVLRDSGCPHPEAAAVGYQEPSLVFLAGTDTRLTDSAAAAEFLRGGECRFRVRRARQEKNFVQRAEAIGLRYTGRASDRSHEYQHGTSNHHRGLSLAGAVMSASDGLKPGTRATEGAVLSRLKCLRENMLGYFRLFRESRAMHSRHQPCCMSPWAPWP